MRGLATFTLLLSAPLLSVAHSGKEAEAELALRKRFLEIHTNNLDHCAGKLNARGSVSDRAMKRRAEKVASLMGVSSTEAAIQARQLTSVTKSHKSSKAFNGKTDPALVFAESNSCVLSPETTEGPFYILGEDIRTEIVEGQAGIPLHLDIQVIDVETCKPIPNTFIEMWNANGTGVYSGALAVVNGLSGMNDKSLLNKNFLRGAQKTDEHGVAQFQTIFPGHYDGRAPHIHVISHLNASARANNTIWDSRVTHVGQVFFDQDLVNSVKKVAPYSTNRQNLLLNSADNILLQEAATSDPFFNYVLLGNSLEKDGVFAWFSFGVNQTFTREIMSVAMRYKEGNKMVTTNPKVPGLDQIFPGGFPTAYNPGMGGFGGGGGGARPTGRP